MKIIIKVLGILVLVVVVLVGVSLYYLDSGIKKAVETFGPDYTLTRVELNDVSLSPLSGKGSLSGLAVGNPQGFSDANAFYLGEIAIAVDTQTLSGDPVIIHSVRIVAPQITFEQGNDGTNLQQLLKNIEQSTGAANTDASPEDASVEAEGEAKKIIIKDLQVSGGRVSYINPLLGGKALELDLPDIQMSGIGEKSNGATGAEVAEQLIAAISKSASSAVSQADVLKDAGKQVEEKLNTEKDKLEKSLGGLKGLFDK
jgi:uncharacterized protein involved in outer membrane biogenesis